MATLAERILQEAGSGPSGKVLSAKNLLHLGSRAGIDQALSRMAREGTLLRIGRGRYVRPVEGRFGTRPPEAAAVIKELASASAEVLVPSGASAANALGLTTQVPVRQVYLTSGRSRRLRLGRVPVELRHAPAWQLRQTPAGEAIRALAWLGSAAATRASGAIGKSLSPESRTELLGARTSMPGWMAEAVSRSVASSG